MKVADVVKSPVDDKSVQTPMQTNSFLPSFLSTSAAFSGPPIDDADDDVDTPNPGVLSNDVSTITRSFSSAEGRSPPVFSSPPSRKQKGGRLLNRLKAVRNGILGDVIRLQSGQYPFPEKKSTFDVNDPRARAVSFMDVTLEGDASVFGTEQPTGGRQLIIRGHIHQHVVTSFQQACSPHGCQAWFVFGCDSTRTLEIKHGVMLRIYNAVPFASGGKPNYVVTCTEFCEPYPDDILPKLSLPDPADVHMEVT